MSTKTVKLDLTKEKLDELLRKAIVNAIEEIGIENFRKTSMFPSSTKRFQARVASWVEDCFGTENLESTIERCYRFSEESIELVQAVGMREEEVHELVRYVFSRPVGDPKQEVGGVEVTLAALCESIGIDKVDAAEKELERCVARTPEIRAKNLNKPRNSPLPGTAVSS